MWQPRDVTQVSAGILLHRVRDELEVLLVHPGGPYWARKDAGAWSIPKGEFDPEVEDPLAAARREFTEELGCDVPDGDVVDLGSVVQKSGKQVIAFAIEGDLDTERVTSNTFTIEWPPRSGRMKAFPEVDRAEWMALDRARAAVNPAQTAFLDRLVEHRA